MGELVRHTMSPRQANEIPFISHEYASGFYTAGAILQWRGVDAWTGAPGDAYNPYMAADFYLYLPLATEQEKLFSEN